MNLYEIETQYREIAEALYESGGALTPELDAQLAISRELFEKKAASYGLIIKELTGDIDQIIDLIEDLTKKKKRLEATRDGLKSRILNAMLLFEREKFKTPLLSMWVQHTKKVVVIDEMAIPEPYRYEVTEWKIDRKALKEALETQKVEPGESAYIAEEPHLQIR